MAISHFLKNCHVTILYPYPSPSPYPYLCFLGVYTFVRVNVDMLKNSFLFLLLFFTLHEAS